MIDGRKSGGWANAVVLAFVVAMAGCSSGSGDDPAAPPPVQQPPPPPPPPPPVGTAVTQTIGAAGGTMNAVSSDVAVALTVPANAVDGNVVFTITPVAPAAGERMRLRIAPSGVQFAAPVQVSFTWPAGAAPTAEAAVLTSTGSQSVMLATTMDVPARRASASFTYLPVDPAAVGGASVNKSQEAAPGDSGSLSLDDQQSVEERVQNAQRILDALIAEGNHEQAVRLQLAIAALLQSTGLDGFEARARPWLEGAKTSACRVLLEVLAIGQNATIDAYGDYQRYAEPIVNWASIAQSLGGPACAGADTNVVANTLNTLIERELTRVQNRELAPTNKSGGLASRTRAIDPINMRRAWSAVASTIQVAERGQVLAYPNLIAETQQRFLTPLNPRLQSSAIELSRGDDAGKQNTFAEGIAAHRRTMIANPTRVFLAPIARLTTNAQYALTNINLATRARVVPMSKGGDARPQALRATTLRVGGGAGPDQEVTTGTLEVAADGTVELAGEIAVLHCPTPASERLVVEFEGHVVSSTNAVENRHLGSALTLEASTLLAAANIRPEDARQHPLTIRRVGSTCNEAFADGDRTLATITLDFTPKRWRDSETLATAPYISSTQALIDERGRQTVFWSQSSAAGAEISLRARSVDAAGNWGADEFVGAGQTSAQEVQSLQVGADAAGNLIVVWRTLRSVSPGVGEWIIWANRRDVATGLWGTARIIPRMTTTHAQFAVHSFAVSAGGDAILAVIESVDQPIDSPEFTLDTLAVHRYRGTTQAWDSPELLASIGVEHARAAIDDAGNAIVAWQIGRRDHFGNPDTDWYQIRARRFEALGGSAEVLLADHVNEDVYLRGVAMNGAGNGFVMWRYAEYTPTRYFSLVGADYRIANRAWDAAAAITPRTALVDAPYQGVALDRAGNALALGSGTGYGQLWRRPVGGAWSAVGATMPSYAIDVRFDGDGNAYGVLNDYAGTGPKVWRLAAGAADWTLVPESAGFGVPALMVNARGEVLMWRVNGTGTAPRTLDLRSYR
jgi:hypothetical protein